MGKIASYEMYVSYRTRMGIFDRLSHQYFPHLSIDNSWIARIVTSSSLLLHCIGHIIE